VITQAEKDYINSCAYLPEHIPGYVTAISGTEPYLINDYLCYYGNEGHLIFIGYPLRTFTADGQMQEILDLTVRRFKPKYVALIAPKISIPRKDCYSSASDRYYKVDLSDLHVNHKLRYMIRHASRELHIEKSRKIEDEHLLLISEFVDSHKINAATRYIFESIPKYLSSVSTALVFSARNKDEKLVAFDIAEFGAKDYAFYMFNFMSRQKYVPGASDFILHEIIKAAQEMKKPFINLGLGISEGVIFFKKKWGGSPFVNYEFCLYERVGKDKLGLFWS